MPVPELGVDEDCYCSEMNKANSHSLKTIKRSASSPPAVREDVKVPLELCVVCDVGSTAGLGAADPQPWLLPPSSFRSAPLC